jgi:uncharacterized cupin superfamily protein
MEAVNEADLDWDETERGETAFRRKRLAATVGAADLGCSLYELPPGKRSWPYHYHANNAEALYVLAGEGQLRAPDGTHRLAPGDYVDFPTGEAGAHRVVNDGDDTLRYLALSTLRDTDVTVYPDSEKIGVYAGAAPGADGERDVSGYYEHDAQVDYWDGEAP